MGRAYDPEVNTAPTVSSFQSSSRFFPYGSPGRGRKREREKVLDRSVRVRVERERSAL